MSWIAFCASARFWRAIRMFFLRFASSILSLSVRSWSFSLSTACFCSSHCLPNSACWLSCSSLRAQRLLGQDVVAGAHRHHRLALPLLRQLDLLVPLLLQALLVGDRDRDLLLRLDQLVLHLEHDLVQHLLRVFRLADEIVEVRFDERAEPARRFPWCCPCGLRGCVGGRRADEAGKVGVVLCRPPSTCRRRPPGTR